MKPGEAIMQLVGLGYRFWLMGDRVKYEYSGPGEPEAEKARPLLTAIRDQKEEARYFLRSYCPRCGGVATCPDYEGRPLCLKCDWEELIRLYPSLNGRDGNSISRTAGSLIGEPGTRPKCELVFDDAECGTG